VGWTIAIGAAACALAAFVVWLILRRMAIHESRH
jgi:hypothetical protein